jgi:hypothetical protein
MTLIERFENVQLFVPSPLYSRVKVFDPAVSVVSTVVVLACTPPVLELVPCSRITARASVDADVVAPETAKLSKHSAPLAGCRNPVVITIARVPVVAVTDGLVPGVPPSVLLYVAVVRVPALVVVAVAGVPKPLGPVGPVAP